jgi:hypothetical protein
VYPGFADGFGCCDEDEFLEVTRLERNENGDLVYDDDDDDDDDDAFRRACAAAVAAAAAAAGAPTLSLSLCKFCAGLCS